MSRPLPDQQAFGYNPPPRYELKLDTIITTSTKTNPSTSTSNRSQEIIENEVIVNAQYKHLWAKNTLCCENNDLGQKMVKVKLTKHSVFKHDGGAEEEERCRSGGE